MLGLPPENSRPAAPWLEAVKARRAEDDAQDTASVRAFGLAHYWQHLLDTDRFGSLTEIAAAEGMDPAQVSRIARLAWEVPVVVDGTT
jgi:hypothetical protein